MDAIKLLRLDWVQHFLLREILLFDMLFVVSGALLLCRLILQSVSDRAVMLVFVRILKRTGRSLSWIMVLSGRPMDLPSEILELEEQVIKLVLQVAVACHRLLKLPLEEANLLREQFYLFAEILNEPALSLIFTALSFILLP